MMLRFLLLSYLLCSMIAAVAQPPSAENMAESRVYFNNGVRLGIDEKFSDAIEEFEKAIELNPLYAEAFLYKGLAQLETGDTDEAIRSFTITIEIDPAYSDQAHYFRGVGRYNKEQYVESIEDLSIAIRMNPDFVAFYQRGKANLRLKEYTRSLQDFEIALRLEPDFYDAYLYRGINLYYLEEYEYAIEDLEIAKKRLSKNAKAFYYSGLARTAIRNSYVAIEDLNRAIELDPSFASAYEARAVARENTGNVQEATRDRVMAREQQQAAPRVVAENSAPAQTVQPTTPPQRSSDINFEALFSRSTTTDKTQDQATSPETTTEQQQALPESDPQAAPVQSITSLGSGTYDVTLKTSQPAGFGVQVASYSNTDNLTRLADAYHQKYQKPVFINVSQVNGRTLYKLIIGTFRARAEAEKFRDTIRQSDFPDSFLVVFENL